MSEIRVIAADQALAISSVNIPQPLIDAWSFTTTFAQEHARTINSDPSTETYFEAMTQELMKIGWNVEEATKLKLNQQAGTIVPVNIVKSVLNPFLTPEQQNGVAGLVNAIQQPDAGVKNFVTFWHNKASTSASQHNMAMGALTDVNNASDIQMVYYSFDFAASAERWLFVEVDAAQLGIAAYHLKMNLNMALYDEVKNGLISKLEGHVKDHIAETTLDL